MGQPAAQLRAAHGIVKVEVRVAQTKLVVLEIGEFAQASALTLSRDSRTLTRGKIRQADEREKLRQPFSDPSLLPLLESKEQPTEFEFTLEKKPLENRAACVTRVATRLQAQQAPSQSLASEVPSAQLSAFLPRPTKAV